jgi:hypothetical protein
MSEATRARVYDPEWKYVPANSTDIRKLFAKVKEELRQQAPPSTVRTLKRKDK